MGLFKNLMSKKSGRPENDIIYEDIFSIIADNDEHAVSDLKYCIENPKLFAKKNEELYDARGINVDTAGEYQLKWIGCVEILLRYNFAKEFDWGVDFEDFYSAIGDINIVKNRNVLPNKDDIYLDYEITNWLSCLDNCWSKSGLCAGGIDIDSDSYVVFICTSEQLVKLGELAEKAGKKITYASKM